LQTSFQTQAFGAGASTTNELQAVTGVTFGMVNVAQFVIVDPTAAFAGIVKFISKYTHCPGLRVAVVVTVTVFPVSTTFSNGEELPTLRPVSVAGTLSVTV
jgi:hypothetical protein